MRCHRQGGEGAGVAVDAHVHFQRHLHLHLRRLRESLRLQLLRLEGESSRSSGPRAALVRPPLPLIVKMRVGEFTRLYVL